ncbi:MAG: hydroxymethylbilane synthase [Candidatus Dormibacteria bacterium]
MTLRLATRGSALARAQASLVATALATPCELVVVTTGGDRDQSTPVEAMSGQGWFTSEVEGAVLSGSADAAVHSAKDLPTALAAGLEVVAVLPRGDVRDALVTRGGALDSLASGACVATSSLRRALLLGALRPDLRVVPMRGNVDTRLRKLDEGEVDGLLVAAAGLDRLGRGERATERLDPRVFVPAPAQGAIAVETYPASAAAAHVAVADDPDTHETITTERAVLVALGGGCLMPLGVWARLEGDELVVSAALAAGGRIHRVEMSDRVERAAGLAASVALALRG